MNFRQAKGSIAEILCGAAALLAAGMLILIIGEVFFRGLPSLTISFLITPESSMKTFGDGIANAIAGSVILSLFATVLAIPFAVSTAIYLQRYAKDTPVTRTVRFLIEVLSGTPSIVLGIFGLLVFVLYLRAFTGGESLIAAAFALAILIVPVIERATEDAIERVPKEYEEGSYALGATKWDTIRGITVPVAFAGLATGAILGFGRAAEESAVVIATTGYSQWIPEWKIVPNSHFFLGFKIYPLNDLVGTLPVSIYNVYDNPNVYPISAGFAAAFILIVIVLTINLSAKIIVSRNAHGTGGKATASSENFIKTWFSKLNGQRQNGTFPVIPEMDREEEGIPGPVPPVRKPQQGQTGALLSGNTISRIIARIMSPQKDGQRPQRLTVLKEKLSSVFFRVVRKPVPAAPKPGDNVGTGSPKPPLPIKKFLRAVLPFAAPVALLLLIAILAGLPPLNHALGPASPSLATLFSTSLTLVVAIAGLIFGLYVAKRGGAFRAKNRKAGIAGVVAGFCLVLAVACVLSSAGSGLFNTGDTAVSASSSSASLSAADRSARRATLIASEGPNDAAGPMTTNPLTPAETPRSASGPAPAASVGGVPVRDALSLRENYQYGDPSHAIRATIYDVKVLPFYFWWWADWNRFVQQVPATGDSYLVVFIRIENTGNISAIIPSADQFNVTYKGVSYGHSPYFDLSLADQQNINDYSADFPNIPYEWIRELGQDKRDYAFLMGYNIFEDQGLLNNTTVTPATPTPTPAGAGISGWQENSVTDMDYLNYNLKPGPSQAIDGYLIYEVPDAAVNDMKNTYMQVAFNGHSATRWCLG